MISYLIIFVSNLLFSISRTYSTICIADRNIKRFMVTSFFVKVLWLISTSLAVKSTLDQDFMGVIVYICSGLMGDYIAMKL